MATRAAELSIGIFAPPLVEPFQPSLSLPYLAAQLRDLGFSPICHNLSSLFYIWLFRRVRLESMTRYHHLSQSIGVLRDGSKFSNPARYQEAIKILNDYTEKLAQQDRLPYSLYPESHPSAVVSNADFEALVERMEGTLLERFLLDYVGFTLRLESYDVIAFSAANAFQLASSLFISRALKRAGVRAHIALGGHAVTLMGSESAKEGDLCGSIDSLVFRGGADVFSRLCRDVAARRPRRVYEAAGSKGGVDEKGFPTDRPYDLLLQHDVHDIYLSPHQVFSVYSALGCSFGACTFCGSNRQNADFVPRQISVLVDEIEFLRTHYGIRHFNICDNNFDPNRARHFCDALEGRGLKGIYWQSTCRVYKSLDVPLLKRMRRNGCVLMNVGLESANDRILRLMRKGYSVEDADRVFSNLRQAGLPVHTYVICGFPGETEAESLKTIQFLSRCLEHFHSVYFQDYEAQLANRVFARALGSETQGLSAHRMIRKLLAEPGVGRRLARNGNLLRRHGYPFVEDHNFLYLAAQHEESSI